MLLGQNLGQFWCVLCFVWFAACSVLCALCFVWFCCVLCVVCSVLCVVCSVCSLLRAVRWLLCAVCSVLWAMCCAQCAEQLCRSCFSVVVLCWRWPVVCNFVRARRARRAQRASRYALRCQREKTQRGKRGKRLTLALSGNWLVSIAPSRSFAIDRVFAFFASLGVVLRVPTWCAITHPCFILLLLSLVCFFWGGTCVDILKCVALPVHLLRQVFF